MRKIIKRKNRYKFLDLDKYFLIKIRQHKKQVLKKPIDQCQFSISFKGKPTHFIHEGEKKNFNAEMKIRELLESHNRDAVSC